MRSLSILSLVSLAVFSCVAGTPLESNIESVCKGAVVVSESYIGEAKNVKVQRLSCPEAPAIQHRSPIEDRQIGTNVCGNTCKTNCFLPAGGGPNPNECHVIANALRFESQNTGALFEIDTATNNPIVMTYRSCETFFVNQDAVSLVYCRTDWADVIDFVAPNCQATQNAHGGNCVATDQRWFIQVQTS